MADSGAEVKPTTEDIYEDGNDLILYQFYPSYFSQRVVFALNEKKLKFKTSSVNLLKGEQFEPSFIKLNPKAEVPVLKDGVKIIPDSNRIIDYLEDNFSNGDTPRLRPEKGTSQYQTMDRFNALIDKVPAALMTYGCFYHPELTDNMKMSPQDLKATLGALESHVAQLSELSEQRVELQIHYSAKKDAVQKRLASAKEVDAVKRVLDDVESLLNEVEKELATHDKDKENWWLCGEKFTIADINLSILLHRLNFLGLRKRYFGDNKHPLVATYFKRVQQRATFRRTISPGSGILGSLCYLGTKEKLAVSLGSAMIVLGIAGLATFLVQRRK